MTDTRGKQASSVTNTLEQALEALEVLVDSGGIGPEDMFDAAKRAIAALKRAIADSASEAIKRQGEAYFRNGKPKRECCEFCGTQLGSKQQDSPNYSLGEPVVWMQSTHLDKFINNSCGADSMLARCSIRQLQPDYRPLYTSAALQSEANE